MTPAEIAAALREIAAYVDLEGNRFRARAYERAARSIGAVAELDRLIAERRLDELPGIGKSLARVIEELATRGRIELLERLRERWPRVVLELAALPEVGPERARRLHEGLAPTSLEEVAALCEAGRVRKLPGFGRVSEARVLEAIRTRHERGALLTLEDARLASEELASIVRAAPGVADVQVCGPVRRWMEVADRVVLAVASDDPRTLLARTRSYAATVALDEAQQDGARDGARIGVLRGQLASGVVCELYVASRERFGVALVLATGSHGHLAALRAHARERGTELERIAAPDEATLYAALGLPWLPPEVRDGTDEIAAALAGDRFDDLIALEDLAGAVHCHTTYSDGKHTIAQMAQAAAARGLGYLTITDHSRSAGYAGGLTLDRIGQQWLEIDAAQRATSVRLLRGTESDILADGSLDYPHDVLAQMDVVIASIHQRHKLDVDAMTRRVVTALRQPIFKIWGHALGRILLHRDPIAVHFDRVLDAIGDSRVAVEINGDPRRLDLDPERARLARARGARFVLSADAHATGQLDYLANAVGIARRARIRRHEVLNTLPPDEFARAVRPA
ncbi:MAG TPA: PHP domain-containing protein [Candidatus Binatia bacterium]